MAAILALGSAMLDLEYRGDEAMLADSGLKPGDSLMLPEEQQNQVRALLDARLAPPSVSAGGSVTNSLTVAVLAGHDCVLLAPLGADENGTLFAQSLRESGVGLATPLGLSGKTGNCLVLTTPDGERSMAACVWLHEPMSPELIDADRIAANDWLVLEGYWLAYDTSFELMLAARQAATVGGTRTAVTLSSAALVQACRPRLMQLLEGGVDFICGNEQEALVASGQSSLESAMDRLLECADEVAITVSERGALVGNATGRWQVPAQPATVVGTVGAGDAFAGAYLAAKAHGLSPQQAAFWGCSAGAAQVQTAGARLDEESRARLTRLFQQSR